MIDMNDLVCGFKLYVDEFLVANVRKYYNVRGHYV